MIKRDRAFFQYKGGDLVYIISPLTSQLWTASHKVTIKYEGPAVFYKIIDPHNCLLMTLDRKILRGLFECERLKPANIRMSQRKCSKFRAIKANYEYRFKISLDSMSELSY